MSEDQQFPSDASMSSRIVLVQDHAVVVSFPNGQASHARKTAQNVADATNKPVALYALRDDLPEPPLTGTAVEPGFLGWLPVQNIAPA